MWKSVLVTAVVLSLVGSAIAADQILVPEAFENFLVVGEAGVLQSLDATGTIADFGGITAPAGWILADGSEYNQVVYAGLFAVIQTNFNTGGETPGFFRVPNEPQGLIKRIIKT